MSLIDEFEEYTENLKLLSSVCQKISMCEKDAEGGVELGDYLVDPVNIREASFNRGNFRSVKASVSLREAYDAIMSFDRLDTFTNMDRSFFYEMYAPIEYEVQIKNSDFQLGVLRRNLNGS